MSDENIRAAIINTLFKAHRNPRGKYLNVTFDVLHRDVRIIIGCDREDTLRELRYLRDRKIVREKKVKYQPIKIGNKMSNVGSTFYYSLSSNQIDQMQPPGKYSSIGFMINRHTIRVLTKKSKFQQSEEYRGDFQSKSCFLPIKAYVSEGDKIQLIEDGNPIDEKTVGEVEKNYGPPDHMAHINAKWRGRKADLGSTTNINIKDSPINAPITVGNSNYVVSYNSKADVENVLKIIENKDEISDELTIQLKEIIENKLPPLLNNPKLSNSKPLLEKIKKTGQLWLIPIITQLIAAYFQYKLGLN